MTICSLTKKNSYRKFWFFAAIFLIFSHDFTAYGFEIEKNPGVPIEKNFIVGPAKVELEVSSGASKTVTLFVENRTGRDEIFEISFEDFSASQVEGETVKLLGNEKSKTSLKDSFFVEKKNFKLSHGDRLLLPVVVTVPGGASSGGKFGSVVVSATVAGNRVTQSSQAYTATTVLGRVATLFFVTVPGKNLSQGELISLKTKNEKKVFSESEIPFRLEYRNTGNVSLNPYGFVEVKNIWGKVVAREALDPWYALPDSVRTRDTLVRGSFFGRYSATAQVNRGYEDIVDTQTFVFYVAPTAFVVIILAILGFLVFGIWKKGKSREKLYE